MKKNAFLIIGCLLLMLLDGCSTEEITSRYLPHSDPEISALPEAKERVYMDKVTGILKDFDGTFVTVSDQAGSYTFDASTATLECALGMVAGDEISVIYEGQLNGTDTSRVHALKIVDELHMKKPLKEQTISATLTGLTNNTVTFTDKEGRSFTCNSTGALQYYQKGIVKDLPVTIHYLGSFPDAEPADAVPVYAPLIKIVSISDTEPAAMPNLAKILPSQDLLPESNTDEESEASEALPQKAMPVSSYPKIRGHLKSLELFSLQFLPNGIKDAMTVDLSSVPCYFPGGFCNGTGIDFYYAGELAENTNLNGVSVLYAAGDDPGALKKSKIVSFVSGKVVGRTANTATVLTADNALVMISIPDPSVESSIKADIGDQLRVVIDPSETGNSTIFKALF